MDINGVCGAYRTISAEAVQVIMGMVPIDLIAEERMRLYGNKLLDRRNVRLETLQKWQNRWKRDIRQAGWTKRLIRHVPKWVGREHGKVDYCLSQFISVHGCFGA